MNEFLNRLPKSAKILTVVFEKDGRKFSAKIERNVFIKYIESGSMKASDFPKQIISRFVCMNLGIKQDDMIPLSLLCSVSYRKKKKEIKL